MIHQGDCRTILPTLAADSLDACVTDPPYHLTEMSKRWAGSAAGTRMPGAPPFNRHTTGFMGKAWDGGDVAFDPATWREVLRVLKPGAHLIAFGGTRTYHRLVCAVEDAGFEIRDTLTWLYGSGFPKSLDVSKAIDKAAGAAREVVESGEPVRRMIPGADQNATGSWVKDNGREYTPTTTTPATDDAAQWDGWGTALKPAAELIVLARKPLSERSVAANVLRWGTGALHIDAARVAFAGSADESESKTKNRHAQYGSGSGALAVYGDFSMVAVKDYAAPGRWPANVILSHTLFCRELGAARVAASNGHHAPGRGQDGALRAGLCGADASGDTYTGSEPVEVWDCAPDCPVALLDAQSGESVSQGGRIGKWTQAAVATVPAGEYRAGDPGFGDTGGASRFFYTAKANPQERSAGLAARNPHPTVKPVALMAWLCRLVTPPSGVVLDPFLGSGTTAIAAIGNGMGWVGIEREAEYVAIAEQRIGLGCEVVR